MTPQSLESQLPFRLLEPHSSLITCVSNILPSIEPYNYVCLTHSAWSQDGSTRGSLRSEQDLFREALGYLRSKVIYMVKFKFDNIKRVL
jgi:hypothetical protein